jgi:hypothetical protein
MSELSALYTIDGANEGCEVKILHPGTGEETGLVIHVLGEDSDEFQRIKRAQQKKRTDKFSRGGFRNPTPTPAEMENDNIELLARATKSWSYKGSASIPGPKGEMLDCKFENVVLFYTASPDARRQIDIAVGDRANFIKA